MRSILEQQSEERIVDVNQLKQWLDAYKQAWENQDADAFVKLFTTDCEYRSRPFTEPVPGKELHAFWRALAKQQQDNHIDSEILGKASGNRAIVNWRASYTQRGTSERREGNGIFLLAFANDGRCSNLWEWQHWRPVEGPLEKYSFDWERS